MISGPSEEGPFHFIGIATIQAVLICAIRVICGLKPMADIVTNHKARRDYHVLDTFEAGIVLRGTEVKSLRAGKGQISDAFARVEKDEVWLYNAHIDEYSHGNIQNHEPKAPRKLLLHKSEIRKLFGLAAVKGNALVPLGFYWKNGKVKVKLAVGKGKQQFDKREDLKRRESDRELKRAQMRRR
jgi:SsrA-binding protein